MAGRQRSLENVGVMFADCYRNLRVLITGHTGFKGSWLALWLKSLGASVTGLALAPDTEPSHWDALRLSLPEHRVDIRNGSALRKAVQAARPEIVFHLAAQPLVRRSYREPLKTWSTNVMGTANLLEVCRDVPGLRSIVVVTTDKCYENTGVERAFAEGDPLGGHDPYSASKAGTELVAASYRSSFFSGDGAPLLATVRAGNVIGGGDWSQDRLVPDLVRAVDADTPLLIRSPEATRPWQFVLEPLAGYLQLGQHLLAGKKEFAEAWNFGPQDENNKTVAQMLEGLKSYWPSLSWQVETGPKPHEAALLQLNSDKARTRLEWKPALSFAEQLAATAAWYRAFLEERKIISQSQLESYIAQAQTSGCIWAL